MQKMMRLSAFCLFVVVLLFFFFCPVPPCGNYVAPGFEHLHDDSFVGTVRIGIGQYSEKKEINKLCDALKDILE